MGPKNKRLVIKGNYCTFGHGHIKGLLPMSNPTIARTQLPTTHDDSYTELVTISAPIGDNIRAAIGSIFDVVAFELYSPYSPGPYDCTGQWFTPYRPELKTRIVAGGYVHYTYSINWSCDC